MSEHLKRSLVTACAWLSDGLFTKCLLTALARPRLNRDGDGVYRYARANCLYM